MKRQIIAAIIIVLAVFLAVSCKPAPEPIGENVCLVDCANMAFYDCTWRITKGGEEIVPTTKKPMGSTFKWGLERGFTYQIEYSVLEDGMVIAGTTFDLSADESLAVLMFTYDAKRGINVHEMAIGE